MFSRKSLVRLVFASVIAAMAFLWVGSSMSPLDAQGTNHGPPVRFAPGKGVNGNRTMGL